MLLFLNWAIIGLALLRVSRALRRHDHLSGSFNSFPYAEVDDHPGQQEAEGKVPLDGAHVVDTRGDLQDLSPAAKLAKSCQAEQGKSTRCHADQPPGGIKQHDLPASF